MIFKLRREEADALLLLLMMEEIARLGGEEDVEEDEIGSGFLVGWVAWA